MSRHEADSLSAISNHVSFVAESPAVDDVADSLFLVGVAGAAIYVDVAVIIVDWLLGQIWHKKLEPGCGRTSRAAWDVHIRAFGIEVCGQADLAHITGADNGLGLSLGLLQRRCQYRHQQCNNGYYYQKFD
jgi:hypothetical protein